MVKSSNMKKETNIVKVKIIREQCTHLSSMHKALGLILVLPQSQKDILKYGRIWCNF